MEFEGYFHNVNAALIKINDKLDLLDAQIKGKNVSNLDGFLQELMNNQVNSPVTQ